MRQPVVVRGDTLEPRVQVETGDAHAAGGDRDVVLVGSKVTVLFGVDKVRRATSLAAAPHLASPHQLQRTGQTRRVLNPHGLWSAAAPELVPQDVCPNLKTPRPGVGSASAVAGGTDADRGAGQGQSCAAAPSASVFSWTVPHDDGARSNEGPASADGMGGAPRGGSAPPLLVGRTDVHVQAADPSTTAPLWNLTLGSVQVFASDARGGFAGALCTRVLW